MGELRNRLDYPDDHIESDNRLSWFLGRLNRKYGDEAFFVHLKRDREATARSFTRRCEMGIIDAYRKEIIWRAEDDPTVDPLDVCRHFWDTVNSNIELFLRDKDSMEFWLDSVEEDFQEFWERIGAEGDLSAALKEWSRKYNASDPEKAPKKGVDLSYLPVRAAKKAARVVRKLPDFLRAA